jgi:hypothetical protein
MKETKQRRSFLKITLALAAVGAIPGTILQQVMKTVKEIKKKCHEQLSVSPAGNPHSPSALYFRGDR